MHFTKVSCFSLAVITVNLVLSHPLNSARQFQSGVKAGVTLQADGGAPVPPVPPKPKTVINAGAADNTAPNRGVEMLQADGGAPVPPVPPKPRTVVNA